MRTNMRTNIRTNAYALDTTRETTRKPEAGYPRENRSSSSNTDRTDREKNYAVTFESHPIAARTRTRCHLCGFAEVRTDEVEDRGVVFLAECPRCENRWTSREPIGRSLRVERGLPIASPLGMAARRFQRVPARVASEVVPAA